MIGLNFWHSKFVKCVFFYIFEQKCVVLALKNGFTSQNSLKIEPMVRNVESRENKVVLHSNVDW